MNENSLIIKKNSIKRYLSQILLNTKHYLTNNKNFSKDSNEPNNIKKSRNLKFPLIKSLKNITSFSLKEFQSNSDSDKIAIKKLLYNSIDLNKQNENIETKIFQKESLPSINNEKKNDSGKKFNLILNELNSTTTTINKSIFRNNRYNINNMKYSFSLKTFNDIKTIKKYHINKLKKNNNKELYSFSKNKIFREIILNEYTEQELNSDKNKILKDFKYYNEWIKNKILKFEKEIPPEETLHRTFEKEYKNSKYNKPLLNLNSLSISFSTKGKYHLFLIPFELLPLFFYKNMSKLKYIITSIFKFDNNFEDIYIDFEEIKTIISYSEEFKKRTNKKKEKKKEPAPKKSVFNFSSLMNIASLNKKINHKVKHLVDIPISIRSEAFTPKSSFNMKHKFRFLEKKEKKVDNNSFDIDNLKRDKNSIYRMMNNKKNNEENNEENIEENNEKNNEESNLYKSYYNKFLFKWQTPKYNYDITINSPEAIFQIGISVLKAYIDIELIFYLIENNFKNWDFYISQYIFSYKECHNSMGKILSVKSMGELLPKELDSVPLLKNSLSTKDMKEIYSIKNKINFLTNEKVHQVSNISKDFEFIYTDENNNNYIKKFHNFLVIANCKSFKNKKYYFYFNFSHMRILNKILRMQGLRYFIKKLIYIDRPNLSLKFRYDKLFSLGKEYNKILEYYEPNEDPETICLKIKENNKDIINICIYFPTLETIKYNNLNNENCFESDFENVTLKGIPLDMLDKLCKSHFNEWPTILLNK